MEKNEYAEIVQKLLEQYDFAELTDAQKAQVLEFISEKEYDELRQTILQTMEYFERQSELGTSGSPAPKIRVIASVRSILNYKIPLYKVAAILMTLLVADFILDISRERTDSLEMANKLLDTPSIDGREKQIDNKFIRELEQNKKYSSRNSIKYTGSFRGF